MLEAEQIRIRVVGLVRKQEIWIGGKQWSGLGEEREVVHLAESVVRELYRGSGLSGRAARGL
jgi:hypothetical protein